MFKIILFAVLITASVFTAIVLIFYNFQLRDKPNNALSSKALQKLQSNERLLIERRQKLKKKISTISLEDAPAPTLKNTPWSSKLQHAKINYSLQTFTTICAGVSAAIAFALLVTGTPLLTAAPAGFVIGFVFPFMYVNLKFKRNIAKFNDEFINALDVIVRGVRTGLPINECFKMISIQCAPPVSDDFSLLIKDLQMGSNVNDALARMRQRVPLASVALFVTTIAIQQKTGGSLSEVLSGLIELLRGKKMLRGKVRALSSQAKTSALIMSAMPLLIIGALQAMSPDHLRPLVATPKGHMVLVGVAVWMGIGGMIMRQMSQIVKED